MTEAANIFKLLVAMQCSIAPCHLVPPDRVAVLSSVGNYFQQKRLVAACLYLTPWVDEDTQNGVDVEIWTAIAKSMGMKLELVDRKTYTEIIRGVKAHCSEC